jgi:hypothetical protein
MLQYSRKLKKISKFFFDIKDPIKSLDAIARYLNVTLEESELRTVATLISFDRMKSDPRVNRSFEFVDDFNFYRQGKVADWKNYLAQADSDRIEEKVREKLTYSERPIRYE